jgi:hypothetical protein
MFTRAPALRHCDHERELIIEMDVSDNVTVGVSPQSETEEVFDSVEYHSKIHSPAECNYAIYDRELMAIIKTLEECRPECEAAAYPLQL